MPTHTYTVEGMTCEHCRQAVTAELMTIDGVHAVEVDLATGAVAVRADSPPDQATVAAAVEEAGYVLA